MLAEVGRRAKVRVLRVSFEISSKYVNMKKMSK
jgi:hypothetical protein